MMSLIELYVITLFMQIVNVTNKCVCVRKLANKIEREVSMVWTLLDK